MGRAFLRHERLGWGDVGYVSFWKDVLMSGLERKGDRTWNMG